MPLEASITAGFGAAPDRIAHIRARMSVIHRFDGRHPASAKVEQPCPMRQFQRIRLVVGGFGISVALVFWQQGAGSAHAASQAWGPVLSHQVAPINAFRQPNSDFSAGHRGIDYRVSLGERLLAPTEGRVAFAGLVVDRKVVTLQTAVGELLEFEPACTPLAVGQRVEPGQAFAQVCDALGTYTPHCIRIRCLHYSLRTADGYLSPQVRTNELPSSVLLPRTGYNF